MRTSLLCETVTGQSMAELIHARDAATSADLVELRLDGVADVDVAGALGDRKGAVIVTCRPTWEGGRFAGSEDERRWILSRALELGADYVDVEWKAGFGELIAAHANRVVLSSHDFEGVPPDLSSQVLAMREIGAAVIKVAVTASRLTDTLPLRDVARDGDAVVIGMGDAGVPSRLLASKFGSRWTYAGNAVAPGQMPARRMLEEFRFRDIGPGTVVFGVVSDHVRQASSPATHNAAFAAAGINAVSVPLPAADAGDAEAFAAALGIITVRAEDGVAALVAMALRTQQTGHGDTGSRRPA